MAGHLVLLGDSILDNAAYVPGRPAVIDQVRSGLPGGWQATLLAVDGAVVEDVAHQLKRLPADAGYLFVSVGGNDALGESLLLVEPALTVGDALFRLGEIGERFHQAYRSMLTEVARPGLPTTLCTIYDAIPGLGLAERTALALFNDVILREAFRAGLPVIDLRLVCVRPDDFAASSPIEPSHLGGARIAGRILQVVRENDFATGRSTIHV